MCNRWEQTIFIIAFISVAQYIRHKEGTLWILY
nr:MAG TPA: hypothetical protein [Caudoviricetes sp.]